MCLWEAALQQHCGRVAMQRSPTCLQVGDHSAAGQRSFGGVQSHRVAGAGTQLGQLVLLLVAFHQERVSCHFKKLNMHQTVILQDFVDNNEQVILYQIFIHSHRRNKIVIRQQINW